MKNKITKFLAYKGKVSIIVADTTNLVEETRDIHDLTPTTTAAMGRVITAMAMIAHTDLKDEKDSITAQFKGNGPVEGITAIAMLKNSKISTVKAYIKNPHVELPLNEKGKLDVGGAVGREGYLNIIKQNEETLARYSGMVPLISGEIAEDFTNFFAYSQQKPTAIGLGVLVDKNGVRKSGGYIINPMPDATEEEITAIENALKESKSISEMLDSNMELQEIAEELTGDQEIQILEEDLDAIYECDCSRERTEKGFIAIGKDDLKKIIDEDGKAEVQCHFCHKKYNFTKEELQNILEGMEK